MPVGTDLEALYDLYPCLGSEDATHKGSEILFPIDPLVCLCAPLQLGHLGSELMIDDQPPACYLAQSKQVPNLYLTLDLHEIPKI